MTAENSSSVSFSRPNSALVTMILPPGRQYAIASGRTSTLRFQPHLAAAGRMSRE